MADYTIIDISPEEPRKWENNGRTIYYITVKLQGHDKPVSIGKRSPNALQIGEVVSGDIIETQYSTDKFKATSQNSYGGKGRDDGAIKAQWAIGQAVGAIENKLDFAAIEDYAKELFAMVDRVKESPKPEGTARDWNSLGKSKTSTGNPEVTTEYGDGPSDEEPDPWN